MVDDWVAALKGRREKIPGDERTLVEALELCPEAAGAINWDKRKEQLVAIRPGPWGEAGIWSSTMTANLLVYLQTFGIPAREGPLDRALTSIGSRWQVDPLADWFAALTWDGKQRIDTWLSRYAGAEATELNGRIGRMYLISMVARALLPGCQCDYALCLEGLQGIGKDQIARLLGGEYYAANLPNFDGRDAQQIATTHWLIGVGELAALKRSRTEHVKAFLTAVEDTYVPKYERWKVTRKRWCTFLFSVNPDETGYLVDPTGNRRIWPVKVTDVDVDALRRDRDQLFAEAQHLYKAGEKWWPVGKMQWAALGEVQAERRTEDAWTQIVVEWLKGRLSESPLTTTEVLTHALNVKPEHIEPGHAPRVGRILKALGYERYQERGGASRGEYFYRLAPVEPVE